MADQKGTLLWLLDETVTAMGGRKLKQWIHQPLANKQSIEARLEIVTSFLEDFMLREEIKEAFKEVYDLERLSRKNWVWKCWRKRPCTAKTIPIKNPIY